MANFLRNLSTKSSISQKLKIIKLFFHRYENIAHIFKPKTQFGHFRGGGRGEGSACRYRGKTRKKDVLKEKNRICEKFREIKSIFFKFCYNLEPDSGFSYATICRLSTPPPPFPLKSGQIGFLVQTDA